jgi:hypothetical protein
MGERFLRSIPIALPICIHDGRRGEKVDTVSTMHVVRKWCLTRADRPNGGV